METDSFFYRLLKELPSTFFELLGLQSDTSREYRFDSVEIKKSFRIDGLFVPRRRDLPVYFLEAQMKPLATFYANLFAKVFGYLQENDPGQDWVALALFGNRKMEPAELTPYEDLLCSRRVTRIYLDEYAMPPDPPLGLRVLQLVSAPESQVRPLVDRLVRKAKSEAVDSDTSRKVIELVEELLMRRFTELGREEVRKMFQLQDIRKSKVWQEAHETGIEKGESKTKQELARKWLAKGKSVKEVAELLDISVKEARELAKGASK